MSRPFAYQLRLDQIGEGTRIDLNPNAGDCADIARQLGLESLGRLEAHAVLTRDGERVHVEGRVLASLEQACVVTGAPVAASVDEPFGLDFLPEPTVARPDEEIELRPDDCDIMFHDGATIDLGAAVVDSLALALDPYPRSAGAEAELREAGVISEEEAGPFAALAALRDKLGKQP
jgi:uncharacterized metal-binding protein YceD (DUF177 family)